MHCCSRPPTPSSLVFIDNTTKLSWKADFLEAKKAAEVDLKSRRAASMRLSSAHLTLHNLEFLHSLDLQPGRVGMKVCLSVLFAHVPFCYNRCPGQPIYYTIAGEVPACLSVHAVLHSFHSTFCMHSWIVCFVHLCRDLHILACFSCEFNWIRLKQGPNGKN